MYEDFVKQRFYQLKLKNKKAGRNSKNLTIKRLYKLMIQPCIYCGVLFPEMHQRVIDRIDGTKGYFDSNIVLACRYCNVSKNDSTLEEWLKRLPIICQKEIPKALYLLYLT